PSESASGKRAASAERKRRTVFFFSSRRRHTRFSRDWSSDVCSSDLSGGWVPACIAGNTGIGMSQRLQSFVLDSIVNPYNVIQPRSEERRVGKEGRSWEAAEQQEKKRRQSEHTDVTAHRRRMGVSYAT